MHGATLLSGMKLRALSGEEVSGGSIDIFKCLDQLNRTFLKRLAANAGTPGRGMEPYFRFIDNFR